MTGLRVFRAVVHGFLLQERGSWDAEKGNLQIPFPEAAAPYKKRRTAAKADALQTVLCFLFVISVKRRLCFLLFLFPVWKGKALPQRAQGLFSAFPLLLPLPPRVLRRRQGGA